MCGNHCLNSTEIFSETCPDYIPDRCPAVEPIIKPFPDKPVVDDTGKWRVLVPEFHSDLIIRAESECNFNYIKTMETITIEKGILIDSDAKWKVSDAVITEIKANRDGLGKE